MVKYLGSNVLRLYRVTVDAGVMDLVAIQQLWTCSRSTVVVIIDNFTGDVLDVL